MIRFAAVSALGILLLSACEQREATPPAPEAPSMPTETTAPANDVVTPDGLGPVRIGMSRAEVEAIWGEARAVGGAEPEVCDEFHPANAPQGVNVMFQDGVLTRITLIRDATIKTDRGFGLGDEALAIKEAYGGAIQAQPHKYQSTPAEDLIAWSRGGSTDYVTDPGARGVRYEIGTDGKARMIHAGGPAIQLVEGCA